MYKDYDDVKDEHANHTEENPDTTCLICEKNGWLEEKKQEQRERKKLRREGRKRLRIKEKREKLEQLQQKMDETEGTIHQEKIEYNKTLKELKRLGAKPDRNRKIVGSDEQSGYIKTVY